ncbi:MAG: hypothetical protein Q9218_004108 [Villophora microphyllina]
MSLQIFIAHTGLRLTPLARFSTLESLQSWIARHSSIDPQDLILMTARGKQIKIQTLSVENEIFVYNRQILSASGSSSSLPTTPNLDPYSPKSAPEGPHDKNDLNSWRRLFEERSAWADELQERCEDIAKQIQRIDDEATIIQRSAAIAVENVKQHIGNLGPKYEDSRIWADNVLQDQSYLLGQGESVHSKYSSISTVGALGACLSGTPSSRDTSSNLSSVTEASLNEFVDHAELTRARKTGATSSQRFKHRANELNVSFLDVEQKANSLVDNFSHEANLSDGVAAQEGSHLLEEIQVVTKKIRADRDRLHGLSHVPDALAQVTRIALLHTRSFIPTLHQTIAELDQVLRRSTERKNDTQASNIQYLQNISTLESRIALVHTKMSKLDVDPDDGQAFDVIGAVIRLPAVYGLLLVECVRRLEWTEIITADSSTLVEEMATFKEEEFKRRRKWVKEMDGAVDLGSLDEMSLRIDVNVQADKQRWPKISREDIKKYTAALQKLRGFNDAIKEIETAFATLDQPTKQQSRRATAFKNGSIHDTPFGRNSLLLRGDDDTIHTLRSEKSRLEEKAKSSDSRIRKLEDLLHRQSQISRPSSSGNPFGIPATPIERHTTSPVIGFPTSLAKPRDNMSRPSSTSSRRVSTHAEPDEKSLGKKIVSLEAELMAEKIQSANLQKDAAARLNAEENLKAQIREAVSTKEDLLGNFEAQQREFDDERRLLEDDNLKLKIRLEEAEDELDRVLGSRDHEARAHALEEELQRMREEAKQDVQSGRAQVDSLRQEIRSLQASHWKVEQEHTELRTEKDKQLAAIRDAQAGNCVALQLALSHLEPDVEVPHDLKGAVQAVETAMRRHKTNLDQLKQLLQTAQAKSGDLEIQASKRDVEVQHLKDRLGNEEMEIFSTRETLAECREDLKRVKRDLNEERVEHKQLKDVHQAEIDGVQAALEESKVRSREFESQLNDFKLQNGSSDERHVRRAKRAEDLSQRLYSQVAQLHKLLEQVGFTVSRQPGTSMTVQKTPRAPGTSTVLSSSGPLPAKTASDPSPSSDCLSWATSDDPVTENQLYDQFTQELNTFDIAIFHDSIIKRIKDVEHLARKWQREARNYRDKSHRFQSEAHEKIAFRSFREGDLALFLPTRNQATRPWAAFNVGAPHYFLREQDSHRLRSRDWLLARIGKIEERVVDLSKSITNGANATPTGNSYTVTNNVDHHSITSISPSIDSENSTTTATAKDDENPFELSDGLRWYLLDAVEEKPGAPINIGLGKATVAAASVDAQGKSVRLSKREGGGEDGGAAKKGLTRSLDSRRSSSNSKKERPRSLAAADTVPPGSSAEGPLQSGNTRRLEGVDGAANGEQSSREAEEALGGRSSAKISLPKYLHTVPAAQSSSHDRPPNVRQNSSPQKLWPQKVPSPEKPKPRAWNSLWSLDLNLESSGKEKK